MQVAILTPLQHGHASHGTQVKNRKILLEKTSNNSRTRSEPRLVAMRRPPYHRPDRLDVKMTPMIDVVFLLLVFFVCTASFRPLEQLLPTNLTLPGGVASEVTVDPWEQELEEVVIRLTRSGDQLRWTVNQDHQCTEIQQVAALLKALSAATAGPGEQIPVILDVSGEIPMESVIDLYDLSRALGYDRIQFAASAAALGS